MNKRTSLPCALIGLMTLWVPVVATAESGEQLFSMLCFACHKVDTETAVPQKIEFGVNLEQPIDDEEEHTEAPSVVAPSILDVQQRYMSIYPQEQPFVSRIKSWVLKPSTDKTLLPEVIHHFGLMPQLGLAEDQAEKVALFIYQTDFSNSQWNASDGVPSQ